MKVPWMGSLERRPSEDQEYLSTRKDKSHHSSSRSAATSGCDVVFDPSANGQDDEKFYDDRFFEGKLMAR